MRSYCIGPSSFRTAMAVGVLLLSASAHATLIGDTVSISLVSPNGVPEVSATPIDETDSVTVTTDKEIVPNNNPPTTNVGAYLLADEFVDVQASSIFLRLEAGGVDSLGNLITGYGAGAYYEIGDLDFAGGSIIGFDVFLTRITNFNVGNNVSFLNGDTFRIFIAALFIDDNPDWFDTGDIEIRLRTSGTPPPPPVPEPGTLALLGFGLAGLALQRRRRSN